MKSLQEYKGFLEEIRRQIGEIDYNLNKVFVPSGNDPSVYAAKMGLQAARTSLVYLQNKIIKEIRDTDQEVRGNKSSQIDQRYSRYLKSVNSPDNAMVKNSENNMTIKKSVFSQNMTKGANQYGKNQQTR